MQFDVNSFGRRIASSNCCRSEVLSKDKYGEFVFWCSTCGNPLDDEEMHAPTVGDTNYVSRHSIDETEAAIWAAAEWRRRVFRTLPFTHVFRAHFRKHACKCFAIIKLY